ncbi:MAG: MFS transporter, partial [Candidatus Omnitrophica bacterium]|nr:MFS transporter [Candidatus Omnitrophota bacterium]
HVQIGLLASIPAVLSSFSQAFAILGVRWVGSRKALLVRGCLFQAVMLIPVAFLVFLKEGYRIECLIIFVVIFRVIGSILGPAWGSLVSDYLPEHLRGEYFGKRSQITSVSGMIAMAVLGIVLFLCKGFETWAFFFIFLLAALCRFISSYYMTRMVELPHAVTINESTGMAVNYRNFVVYIAAITFATQLVAPFTSVYMLKDLHFNYLSYMSVILISSLTGLISFPAWGRNADVVGNLKVMKLTGWLLPFVPLLYVFCHLPWQLMIVEAFNGFIWAGFNLCATNFIYDSASAEKRVQFLCYSNVINGMALFSGASLGGFLASRLPSVEGSQLFYLFLLSTVCRLTAQVFLFPHIKEVRRSYQRVNSSKLFVSVLGIRPLLGHNTERVVFPDPQAKGLLFIFRWLFHVRKLRKVSASR